MRTAAVRGADELFSRPDASGLCVVLRSVAFSFYFSQFSFADMSPTKFEWEPAVLVHISSLFPRR